HPVLDESAVLQMRHLAREMPIAPSVRDFALKVVLGTHPGSPYAPATVQQFVRYGSSPRGAQAIITAAKIRALLAGRLNVAREDIAETALPALRHRLLLNFEGEAGGVAPDSLVRAILEKAQAEPDVRV